MIIGSRSAPGCLIAFPPIKASSSNSAITASRDGRQLTAGSTRVHDPSNRAVFLRDLDPAAAELSRVYHGRDDFLAAIPFNGFPPIRSYFV